MRWFYRAIGGGTWPIMRSHVSWCTKAMRVSLLRQKQYYVVWDDGEPKCEIMVASSVWEGAALWFDVSLLITTTGPVRVGCVPPAVLHCYLVLDTSTRLLYVPHVGDRKYRIHEREHRRRSILHNSWKGASTEEYTTEFMKGSDLVLEKSVFTEYVPTRVYRAHLKTFIFRFDKSQLYY